MKKHTNLFGFSLLLGFIFILFARFTSKTSTKITNNESLNPPFVLDNSIMRADNTNLIKIPIS